MTLRIREVMERNITDLNVVPLAVKVAPDAKLDHVVGLLRKSNIGSVVVAEGNKVVGIFTERDHLLKVAGKSLDHKKEQVQNYMTKDPVCIQKDETIGDVLKKMRNGNFRHLIIVDAYHNLERVISVKDVIDYVIDVLNDLAQAEPKKAA